MKSKSTKNSLTEFSTSELLDELRYRADILAIKVWTRRDVEDWISDNRATYQEMTDEDSRRIADEAMKSPGGLEEASETDWATLEYYMQDVVRQVLDPSIRRVNFNN